MATKQRKAAVPARPAREQVHDPSAVTAASEWRSASKEGFVIELPSGKFARVKRTMNLLSMLEKGKIPNPLAGMISTMIREQKPMPDMQSADMESVGQLLELVNKQMLRCFVEPRVEAQPDDWDEDDDGEWEPSEGAITLDDITWPDKMYVFAYAQGMALDLSGFREQQEQALATAQHGTNVQDPPVTPPASDGPVPGILPGRGDLDVGDVRGAEPGRGSGDTGEAKAEGSDEAADASKPAEDRAAEEAEAGPVVPADG